MYSELVRWKRFVGGELWLYGVGHAQRMLHAMEGARDHGWPAVIFEGDNSLEIINILSDGSKSFAYYGAILESCSVLVHHFNFVKFQFVKRTRAIL